METIKKSLYPAVYARTMMMILVIQTVLFFYFSYQFFHEVLILQFIFIPKFNYFLFFFVPLKNITIGKIINILNSKENISSNLITNRLIRLLLKVY